MDDGAIIKKATEASKSGKFEKLWSGNWEDSYPSQSEADLALLGILAFWVGDDPERIDRLFRQSELYRPKWEDPGYRRDTIFTAMQLQGYEQLVLAVWNWMDDQDWSGTDGNTKVDPIIKTVRGLN